MKLVRIAHWSDSDENAIHCEIACDCVKRANVILGLNYVKKFRQEANNYPQADICSALYSDHDDKDTPNKRARCGGAPQAFLDKRRHRNIFETRPLQAHPKK